MRARGAAAAVRPGPTARVPSAGDLAPTRFAPLSPLDGASFRRHPFFKTWGPCHARYTTQNPCPYSTPNTASSNAHPITTPSRTQPDHRGRASSAPATR